MFAAPLLPAMASAILMVAVMLVAQCAVPAVEAAASSTLRHYNAGRVRPARPVAADQPLALAAVEDYGDNYDEEYEYNGNNMRPTPMQTVDTEHRSK